MIKDGSLIQQVDFTLPASNFPTENNEEAKKIRIKRKSDHTN